MLGDGGDGGEDGLFVAGVCGCADAGDGSVEVIEFLLGEGVWVGDSVDSSAELSDGVGGEFVKELVWSPLRGVSSMDVDEVVFFEGLDSSVYFVEWLRGGVESGTDGAVGIVD